MASQNWYAGSATTRRAAGYRMTVIAVDTVCRDCPEYVDELREQTPDSLCSLLERSDAVTERVRARKASC